MMSGAAFAVSVSVAGPPWVYPAAFCQEIEDGLSTRSDLRAPRVSALHDELRVSVVVEVSNADEARQRVLEEIASMFRRLGLLRPVCRQQTTTQVRAAAI
jgi:hypothetical protein